MGMGMDEQEKKEVPLPPVDVSQLYERLKLTSSERLRVAVESANNVRQFLENVRLLK